MIDQLLMSAFGISLGQHDSFRAFEVVPMLRISCKKVEKRIEKEDEGK